MCNTSASQLPLQDEADITVPSGEWGSILQAAAQKGDEGMIRVLLELGADIYASDGLLSQGRNALHSACGVGSLGCVDLLLSYGSDPWISDKQSRTCLHHAASSNSVKTVDLLLKKGLDPRTSDINN